MHIQLQRRRSAQNVWHSRLRIKNGGKTESIISVQTELAQTVGA